MYETNPANTAGTNGDGSKSLAKESKVGLLVSFVLSVAATAALGWLGQVDLSTLPGWAASAGTLAVSAAAGLLAAYLKRNR